MSDSNYKDSKILENLYWKQHLSLRQIGKQLGITKSTVLKKMKECNIQRRFKKEETFVIPRNALQILYWRKGYTLSRIANELRVSDATVLRRMKKYKIHRRNEKTGLQKSLLVNLYVKEKLTTREVAEKLKCSQKKILYWMKKYNISRRDPHLKKSRFALTRELLTGLYLIKKMSIRQIATKINCSDSIILYFLKKYGIERRSISEATIKYPKIPFSGNLEENAYLIGLRMGDVSARRMSKYTIRVQASSSRLSLIEMFKNVFEKYGRLGIYKSLDPVFLINEIRIWCDLENSFEFILKKPTSIPYWILENDVYFYSFLAGYADCEACWDIVKLYDNSKRFEFALATTDKQIIKQITEKLTELGFSAKFYKKMNKTATFKANKPLWIIRLYRKENVVNLAKNLLPFSRHIEKINKMKLIVSVENKAWDKINPLLIRFKEWRGKLSVDNETSELSDTSTDNFTIKET